MEFGPVLGLDPIYLNLSNKNAKVKLYDLPAMIKMQKNVHQYWNNQGFAIDTSKYEYYSDFEKLITSSKFFASIKDIISCSLANVISSLFLTSSKK